MRQNDELSGGSSPRVSVAAYMRLSICLSVQVTGKEDVRESSPTLPPCGESFFVFVITPWSGFDLFALFIVLILQSPIDKSAISLDQR